MLQILYVTFVTAFIFLTLRLAGGPVVMGHATVSAPPTEGRSRLPVLALGWSLGLFFAITFVFCVSFDLLFPEAAMFEAWFKLFPGFIWISWPGFLIGLIESFLYGWYIALIFGPLYNFFANKK